MRRLLIALVVLVILAAGGQLLFWRWAEGRLERGYATWRDQAQAEGWTVESGLPAQGGWPLAASLTLPAPVLRDTGGNVPGGLRWSADAVTLRVSLLQPGTLLVRPDGVERLQVEGAPEVAFGFAQLAVTVPLAAPTGGGFAADILAKGGHAALSARPADAMTVADLTGHLGWQPVARGLLSLGLRTEAIDLPPGPAWPLGPRLSSFSLDAALHGAVPPGPNLFARAAAWRDAGGTLEVARLSTGWGPLGLTGSATLSLDGMLQPAGAGVARVIGYAETLDALAASGTLSRGAALAAKAVLSLMARTPEGGVPEVELPLALQDRSLSMGGIPVTRLPELSWPLP